MGANKDIGERVNEAMPQGFLNVSENSLYENSGRNLNSGKGYRGVVQTGPGQHIVVHGDKVLGNASLYKEKR